MKLRLIIFLFFLPIIMMAQDTIVYNHPKYYQDGDYWVQAQVPWDFEIGSGVNNFSLLIFYINGDTIIDNKEYKCVHAKTWTYDCEETYDHQPEGLVEGIQIPNVLFMREDADGKQWRRLAYLNDEALLFDFSRPFEEGQNIRYCQHENLSDMLDWIYYESTQAKVYSNLSCLNGTKAWSSDDKAPHGYIYYNIQVNNVTMLDLPNGEQVPFANGRVAFGWGDVYQGDLLHQFQTDWESEESIFMYRVHQGQVILRNNGNVQSINNIIGTDVISLFDKPEGYRPFVEEGKVWKVGGKDSGNPVKFVAYYYFDGDTIIGGKTCKQMMCQRYISPDHPDYAAMSEIPFLRNVGAWYEEDKKVYYYDTISKQFRMMYDFSLEDNETLQIDEYNRYVIGPKQTGSLKGFKGVYRDVMMLAAGESHYNTTWLEGVGGIDGPTVNFYYGKEGHALFLMSCTVGDEVIYLNDEYEDGATSDVWKTQKVRFDFTHTVKTQPKVKASRIVAEKSLYGEYNALQLDVNLAPLDDVYQVRIIDASGKTVYEKTINAGNIVGLNIDISDYTEGCYTVSVENNRESFIGEFNSNTTGIEEVRSKGLELSGHYIYNLQGQRLSTLQKGLNIVDGRKVYVK